MPEPLAGIVASVGSAADAAFDALPGINCTLGALQLHSLWKIPTAAASRRAMACSCTPYGESLLQLQADEPWLTAAVPHGESLLQL